MSDRMEIVAFERGRDERVRPRRWGTAVPRRQGGWTLYLTMPWGEMELVMQEPRERGERPQAREYGDAPWQA